MGLDMPRRHFYHRAYSCDSESLMVAESGNLSKSGLGIGGNGCFGAAIEKPLVAEIGQVASMEKPLPMVGTACGRKDARVEHRWPIN
jgi:hypothetical protein